MSVPTIDKENHEWIISRFDIECLSVGAGILGCGGGGSPYLGKLRALKALENGRKMRIVDPVHFYENADPEGDLAVLIAYMGAPMIIEEKAVNKETVHALRCMQDIYAFGKYSGGNMQCTDGHEVKGRRRNILY